MSNIYRSLTKLYKKPLVDIAKKLNYSRSNIYILENNFEQLKIEFPNVWNTIISCQHNMDKRTPEEYALDLVSSWLYEDTILSYLNANDYIVKLDGSDANRQILINSKVSSNSDYIVIKNDVTRHIELINSYTPYWEKTKKIDLRDNKYNKIKSSNSLLLCIDIYSKKFYIIDLSIASDENVRYIPFHKPYGKPAYQINISSLYSHTFSIKNLIIELDKFFTV